MPATIQVAPNTDGTSYTITSSNTPRLLVGERLTDTMVDDLAECGVVVDIEADATPGPGHDSLAGWNDRMNAEQNKATKAEAAIITEYPQDAIDYAIAAARDWSRAQYGGTEYYEVIRDHDNAEPGMAGILANAVIERCFSNHRDDNDDLKWTIATMRDVLNRLASEKANS